MFDHVTIRVSDLAVSRPFYELALGDPVEGGGFSEWHDFSIAQADDDRPLTRNLHAAFVTRSREAVDEWWERMTGAHHPDDGAPGPRPYSPDYYGAFVLDPDGNSVEAIHAGEPRRGENFIDHLWIGVADLAASRRFYEAISPVVGVRIPHEQPERERFHVFGGGRSFGLVHDGRPATEHVHLAFGVPDDARVDEFHRVATGAGYRDNGAPGERAVYHEGYYGAFVLDPDGNNVEAVCHNRHG